MHDMQCVQYHAVWGACCKRLLEGLNIPNITELVDGCGVTASSSLELSMWHSFKFRLGLKLGTQRTDLPWWSHNRTGQGANERNEFITELPVSAW
jgi:hypothetical protein